MSSRSALEPGAGAVLAGVERRGVRAWGDRSSDAIPSSWRKPPVCRSASPSAIAADIATLSERSPGRIGITSRASAASMHRVRHAGAIRGRTAGRRPAGRRGRDSDGRAAVVNSTSRSACCAPPGVEGGPGGMAHDRHLVEVVHSGAAEGAVGDREAGRLDDVGLDPEAGAEPQNRSGILRDIGLVEGDPHGVVSAINGAASRRPISRVRRMICATLGRCAAR